MGRSTVKMAFVLKCLVLLFHCLSLTVDDDILHFIWLKQDARCGAQVRILTHNYLLVNFNEPLYSCNQVARLGSQWCS